MSRTLVDSGIDWIGKIPEIWTIQPLGLYLKERNEKVSDIDYEPLSVTKNGIVPQLENAAKSDAHDARKRVCKNDFVINSRSDRKQSCGLSNLDGSVSLINTVLQINEYVPNYVKYMLDNTMFAEEFYRNGHGIVADLWTTKYSEMKNIYIPKPSKEEQTKIADYLDEKCSKIDKTIEENTNAIELLEEYKKSVISKLVFSGIKHHNLKEGKVFGNIPNGWTESNIRILFNFSKGLSITKENLVEVGIPVISYGQIHSKNNTGVGVKEELIRYVPDSYLESDKKSLASKSDIIFADTSEDLDGSGNCIFIDTDYPIFAGYHTIIAHPNEKITKYFAYLFQTDKWRSQIRSSVYGVKLFSITQKILKTCSILIPPLDEQKEIVKYLDRTCQNIDKVITYRKQIISKLEEYKKSLIYEVVTGKKEV